VGVVEGEIDVYPLTVDFGTVPVGSFASKIITVRNIGAGFLNVNAIASGQIGGSPFHVDFPGLPATVLGPGPGSTTFSVSFIPTMTGNFQQVLLVTSDDFDEGTVAVTLKGRS